MDASESTTGMKHLLDRCLAEHPHIAAYDGIFGGTPHLKDRRFTVGNVLARLYTEGSVQAVAEAYDIPAEELLDALAFAQDFVEDAFHAIVVEGEA